MAIIFYVRPVNGSDASAGTTFNTAKKSLAAAYAVAGPGDTIRCSVEANELITSSIVLNKTNINYTDPLIIEAANTTDGEALTDGTKYVLQWDAQPNVIVSANSGANWHLFRYIQFQGGERGYQSLAASSNMFFRCRITGSTANGTNLGNSSAAMYMVDCEVDNNTGRGISQSTTSRGRLQMIGGSVHNNGGDGINLGSSCNVFGVLIYGNGGNGIAGGPATLASNCTIYNNTGTGIVIGAALSVVANCAFVNNGAYGLDVNNQGASVAYNHFHGNTSGAMANFVAGWSDLFNQSGDPLFANAGAADFTPGSGSPLIGTGANGGNIGAVAHPEGGGGGGGGTRVIAFS